MRKKALIECDYVLTSDRFKLTLLDIEEAKLKSMIANNGAGITIEQSLVHLSKWVGSWINPKAITAAEYFNLMDEYGRITKIQGNG